MSPALLILIGIAGISISVGALIFIYSRPTLINNTGSKWLHVLLITVNSAVITFALARLGEPQACWLAVDMLGGGH